ncbi:unnamed protein product [Linum trigynum]|uniref:Uncharacterized protein n=1 Tax=Linum trigynum TaxID=586398 RepID=A0AAV2G1Z9_9ROSI
MAIAGTVAKLAAVVLLLTLPCIDSKAINPQSEDAPTNVSNVHQNLGIQMQPERGTNNAVVILPQGSDINPDYVGWCSTYCNDQNCRLSYPDMCDGQDRDNCYIGCYCEDLPYRCECLCSE